MRALPKQLRQRVDARALRLAENPRPHDATKLHTGGYRIRIGDYRLIYDIDSTARVVTVSRIAHREAYR